MSETSKSHHVLVDGHAHHHVFVSAINLQLLMRLWREKQVEIISDFLVRIRENTRTSFHVPKSMSKLAKRHL